MVDLYGSSATGYPKAFEALIAALRRLPGIGARTAERLALALLEWPDEFLAELGDIVLHLRERIRFCTVCGNLADSETCRICSDHLRTRDLICVVEQAAQIPVIERAGCFRGLYHVLGGRITPLEGRGPEDLRVEQLHDRLRAEGTRELILATSSDVEGEATATYLAEEFRRYNVRITRIATGVPVGSDLTFADSATVATALNARRSVDCVPEPPL